MVSEDLDSRLQQVFAMITEPGYSTSSNYCLESLLTHLSVEDAESTKNAIELPSVSEWINFASTQLEGTLKNCSTIVKTFFLKLTALATENCSIFVNLMKKNVYKNIFEHCNLQSEKNPSLKLGILKILTSLTNHQDGAEWIFENEQWQEVVNLCNQNQTIYLSRASYNFISVFLWKLNSLGNENSCNTILTMILQPIINNKWTNTKEVKHEDETLMDQTLIPTINLLIEVMQNLEHFGKTSIVMKVICKNFNIERHLWNLFQLSRSSVLISSLSKLLFVTHLAKIYVDKNPTEEINQTDIVEFCLVHCNIMNSLIWKGDAENVLQISNFCFGYMSKVQDFHKISLIVTREDTSFEFTNQILIICLIPTLCATKSIQTDLSQLYMEKLISLSCEHTTRMAYSFRDLIKERNDPQLILKAIQNSIQYKKFLNKSQAVIIFQSFYYSFQAYLPKLESQTENIVVGVDGLEATNVLYCLLNALYIYIYDFDIIWQECVEVLCVYNFCTRIIKTGNLDPKLTIQAFKLARLSIQKFLSPNLALLESNSNGSVLEEIGKDIYEKLHNISWDIRDSAMELLYVVSDVAEFKFPAFQKQLMENGLPELVVTLALEDSEPYVRASALRCIGTMVRIQQVWEKHFRCLNLPTKMMELLYEESEGLVRKEAASVMMNIYEHHKFSSDILDNVFLTMFHSAVRDLHWEVQLMALQFWKRVIANQLTHQGMIDGIFPSVTFSKENRKIVTLTEIEIKRRLVKILDELALRGCLGALLGCMKDDSEIEVMENALEIINELMQLLQKYDSTDLKKTVNDSANTSRPVFDEKFLKDNDNIHKIGRLRNNADVKSDTNNITLKNGRSSESVIDSIVNADDLNLLACVYSNQLKVKSDEKKSETGRTDRSEDVSSMFVDPEEFVNTVKTSNYQAVIDERKRWLSVISTDINSLLDDILVSYKATDVNSMDCY